MNYPALAAITLLWVFGIAAAFWPQPVYVDPATGCHYLTTPAGGITPRLAPAGWHICSGEPGGDDEAWEVAP